ncbi:retrovirus-related pol polyprotein from transposon TNT 1-94 [Tanacetum coccineum]
MLLVQAQESGQVFDENQLAFLADPGVSDVQDTQKTITHNAGFQTDDLDAYDSDCDDISSAKAILMANLSSYDLDVLSEKAQRIKPTLYDGNMMSKKHDVISMVDEEETFSNPISEQHVVQTTPVRTKAPSELPKKEIFLDNDRLLEHIICQEVMNIVMHADSIPVNVLPDYIDEYSKNRMLKAELAKKEQMVEKKFFDEVVLRFSRLKNHNVNLELKLQHQKETKLDAKDVSIANLRKHIESLKGKNVIEKDARPNKAKVIAPGMFKLDLEPLSPKEVLVYVITTCPSLTKPSEKLIAITPLNKNKKVRMKSSTSTSRSQPSGNTKNNRILRTTNVKHSMLNVNSEIICATCNGCMFDAIHDSCVLDFVIDVNVRSKSKSSKSCKNKTTWKPTGKVFTTVGCKWIPIGQKFTLEGNRFGNDQIAKIMGYGDYQIGNLMISRVYYVEGLGHNLFSVGQFCDSDVEDEVPEFMIKFLKIIQVRLNATVRNIRTDNGIKFVNQTLRAYYEDVRISHQTYVARSPQLKGIVERQNQTLVEAARTMLIFSKLTTMAYKQFSSGPEPQLLTPETLSSGLVPNAPSPTPYVPPTKKDWEILFPPMFDQYFNPPPSVAFLVPIVVAPVAANLTGSPYSTTIDQDAPSTKLNSKESSSRDVIPTNVHSVNQPPEHL